jgi:hypothetical protein
MDSFEQIKTERQRRAANIAANVIPDKSVETKQPDGTKSESDK